MKILESATVEFYKAGEKIRVIMNRQDMSLEDLIRRAKKDDTAYQVLKAIRYKMNIEAFDGSIIDFIRLNFNKFNQTYDLFIRQGQGKNIVQFDNSEMLPRYAGANKNANLKENDMDSTLINDFITNYLMNRDVNISTYGNGSEFRNSEAIAIGVYDVDIQKNEISFDWNTVRYDPVQDIMGADTMVFDEFLSSVIDGEFMFFRRGKDISRELRERAEEVYYILFE